MRASNGFGRMRYEHSLSTTLPSHQLLIRGNFIRPLQAGVYSYMPFGNRVVQRLCTIMNDEIDTIGGQEMLMPSLQPSDLWWVAGRLNTFDALMRALASDGKEYVIAPGHEELIHQLVSVEVQSYRDLPQIVYHIAKKFRYEQRPRGGIIRLREFTMHDTYSFHEGQGSLDDYYRLIRDAYLRVFQRCSVPVIIAEADVGAMRGEASHEFAVKHVQGEARYLECSNCGYAANTEAATFERAQGSASAHREPVRISTPDCYSVDSLCAFTGVDRQEIIKSVFFWYTPVDDTIKSQLVLALVRGDVDVNEAKLINVLGGGTLRFASDSEILSVGAIPGYGSPVGMIVAEEIGAIGLHVIGDTSIAIEANYIIGANEEGFHLIGTQHHRDYNVTLIADIGQAGEGHRCSACQQGTLTLVSGIEVAHIFKLGTYYSHKMGCTFTDEHNQSRFVSTGCYGIGVDRLMAAIVELHHDSRGIIWPDSVAPYFIHFLPMST